MPPGLKVVEAVVAVVVQVHEPDADRDQTNGEENVISAEPAVVNDIEDDPGPRQTKTTPTMT